MIRFPVKVLLFAGLAAAAPSFAGAQSAPEPAASNQAAVVLNPFEVTSDSGAGYRKLSSVTTSRVAVSLYDAPQNIEIIPAELMTDLSITSQREMYRYNSSVTSNEFIVFTNGLYTMHGFDLPQFINGMSQTAGAGVNTFYAFLPTDNVDRVEMAKGPTGLFYANTTPNGVANVMTKQPQFIDASTLDLEYGSFNYEKAAVDVQQAVTNKIAYRVIAADETRGGRVNNDRHDYTLVDPSITVKPSRYVEAHAEFFAVNYKESYDNSPWQLDVNPRYYQEAANPDPAMIGYVEKTYGAASTAAALSTISTRWGANAAPNSTAYQTNFANDYFGATGVALFPLSGQSIDWKRYSPEGNRFLEATPDSNENGRETFGDASVTITPLPGTSIKYHWLHEANNQQLQRGVLNPNAGPLDAAGFDETMGAIVQSQVRDIANDTQQLDFAQILPIAGTKNTFDAGLEMDRTVTWAGSQPVNYALAGARPLPGGGTESGQQAINYFYPYSQAYPIIDQVLAGEAVVAEANPLKTTSGYASYRGSYFDDKLNVLAGARDVANETSGLTSSNQHLISKTFGAIGEVLPGLYAYATYSTTFNFSNGYTLVSAANGLPLPGATSLGNESSKGWEAGLKSALFNEKLSGTISFYQEQRAGIAAANVLAQALDPRNTDADPNNDVRYNSTGGESKVAGMDADFIWTPSPQWEILLNGSWMPTAHVVSDPAVNTVNPGISWSNELQYIKDFDRRLAACPLWAADLVAKYKFTSGPLKNFYLGGAVRYKDDWYLTNQATIDIWVPTQVMVDAFGGYSTRIFSTPTTVQFAVNNLTNNYDDFTRGDGLVGSVRLTVTF